MTASEVTVTHHGGTAVISLEAPQRRNSLTTAMVQAVGDAFDRLESDESVRCVVITGSGGSFCAGADLRSLRAAAAGDFDTVRGVYDGFLRVLRSPLVTVAAVSGPAVGAGFNLALACDLRLAGKSARFDTRFAQLRIHPGGGHAWLLARAVGQQQATLATLFGEVWSSTKALEVGLVAEVHDDDDLLAEALALGRRLDDQEPVFVRKLVSTIRQALVMQTHDDALEHETAAQHWSTTRSAFADGVRAIEESIAATRRR